MKLALISSKKSDLSKLLQKYSEVEFINPNKTGSLTEKEKEILKDCDSICILGSESKDPILLSAQLRNAVEEERAKGKKVFAEFIVSLGDHYSASASKTSHDRLCCVSDEIEGLEIDSLLDDHYNNFTSGYFKYDSARPLLVYRGYIGAHDKYQMPESEKNNFSKWGLWLLDDNTLISSFCLSNFNKARLAPRKSWQSVIAYIIKWLTGEQWDKKISNPCRTGHKVTNTETQFDECIKKGINWFTDAKMLVDEGKSGVLEGYSHHIEPDGNQLLSYQLRTDCSGETAGVYLLDYILNKNEKSRQIYSDIKTFIFENMIVKSGEHAGMVRWTTTAWGVCYQDDVARAFLPFLLDNIFYNVDNRYEQEIYTALDFLVKTTGKNGIRPSRTDNGFMNEAKYAELRQTDGDLKCAHYNAYYHAALLLAYKRNGKQEYLDTAVKGLGSIMEVYPDTVREQSETEELCRLIFPLACLFEITKEQKHKEWLYTVSAELENHRHSSGGYCEWDTGYKAGCARKENGECSLLANNGDPVSDLLYSVNWLPLGFSYAFYATGDEAFKECWEDIVRFFIRSQIYSSDKKINGAWARAYDLERDEIYGVPHDIGWGPCAIESGWTVAEILLGLQFGKYIFKK